MNISFSFTVETIQISLMNDDGVKDQFEHEINGFEGTKIMQNKLLLIVAALEMRKMQSCN